MTWRDVWHNTLALLIVVVALYALLNTFVEQPRGEQDVAIHYPERMRTALIVSGIAIVILRFPPGLSSHRSRQQATSFLHFKNARPILLLLPVEQLRSPPGDDDCQRYDHEAASRGSPVAPTGPRS